VCAGAAILAIGLSLIAMSAIALVAGAGDAAGAALSGHALHVAAQDGAAAFYLTQLVSVSFFSHTAGLRFAALPGLVLVGLAIATAATVATRIVRGSVRRRMLLATSIAIPYALLSGLGARYVPLRFTAPGIGNDVAVLPSAIEAFVLPLAWGLLFAPVGGLVGVFGRDWRRGAARLLGAWATPLGCSLRALAGGLALSTAVVVVGGAVLVGESGDARSLLGGGFGHAVIGVGAALVALPTLVVSLFLACFGVSFDWQVEALNRTQGSGSILGGTLPSTGASPAHGIPAALVLLLLLAAATVFSAGWLTARRSGEDMRLSLANALRTGALTTLSCWLFALLARVDAQAGGFLGLHFEADVASLLWRVPLWCFLGSATGSVAYLATRGPASRRQLAAALLAVTRPFLRPQPLHGRRVSWRQGLAARAVLGLSFLSLPAMLLGIGSAGARTSSQQATVSLAPLVQAAEQQLRRDAVPGSRLSVSVDPSTRVADSANVQIPLDALGIAPSQTPVAKAKAVLARYGELFGTSGQPDELGEPVVLTNPVTKRKSHVYFTQMVDGVPVYGNSIGVNFSPDGKYVNFISGSFIPDVSLASDTPAIGRTRAISIAKTALPNGKLVHPPHLEVYAGGPAHPFGPAARLAWFVWLSAGPSNASNEYVIDAVTGSILHVFVKSFGVNELKREVYSAKEEVDLPGTLVLKDPEEAKGSEDAVDAYDYLKDAYTFFGELKHDEEPWYGYNGQGTGAEKATVLYGKECKEEAKWEGARQDAVFCKGFPKAMDVVGHEYAEAITEHSAGENLEGASGAIAEGFADAMGEALEAYEKVQHKESEEPTWEFGKSAPGGPFRDLKEPGKYWSIELKGTKYYDPAALTEYKTVCADNDGIHENSTIISHAFYELAKKTKSVEKAANIFFFMQTEGLYGQRMATFEQAREAAERGARELYPEEKIEGKSVAEVTKEAFKEVGIYEDKEPPAFECTKSKEVECLFENTLQAEEPAHGSASTLEMLATLYRARGELAQNSAAGKHFLPLYEENMGRIDELVARDPGLEEMSVNGLEQIAPALNALAEGKGQKFKLSASEMAQIEAALKRLAQDDRLFSGGGTLATLIERELKWLRLPSYAGMTYKKGFARLNAEVKPNTETTTLVDPNCSGTPYDNEFQIDGFAVNTPGHYKPEEVSPITASGVACGAMVEKAGEPKECNDKKTLNTGFELTLPPGDELNETKAMEEGAYIGTIAGRTIACAGEDSKILYGATAVTAIKNTEGTECPKTAIACYEVRGAYESSEDNAHGEGHGYAWVTKNAEKRLVLTTGEVKDTVEGEIDKIREKLENVPVGFGQFGVEICARAGKAGTDACGTGSSAPWVHKNGEEGQPCGQGSGEQGHYAMVVENRAEEKTPAAERCVYWGEEAHKQTVDKGNSITGVSCVRLTKDCVVTDNKGNELYSTNVSATAESTWTAWTGPTSPGEAIACPTTALCALADGKVGSGGDMYYATSLGGAWSKAFEPSHGALAVSCPSASLCVDGQESGTIRYSTNPGSTSWTELTIGSGAMNSVFCVSSSFCAAVNGSGDLYVAATAAKIKEASGWTKTDVDGTIALHGVACTSTASCVAVDEKGDILNLAINTSGEATATKQDIDGTNDLTAVTCVKIGVCVAVDSKGNVLVSRSGGATWNAQYTKATLGSDLTSVSCASGELCVAADIEGDVTAFRPASVPLSDTQAIDSGNSLSSVSCIPTTLDCVVGDNKGNALYASAVSASASAEWKTWSGPASPSEAVACPASSMCVLADGLVKEGVGGDVYYATSLDGAWKEAFKPTFGVVAISCPSTSFCVDAQEASGDIRYSTNPASTEWTSLKIGEGAMHAVDCVSSAFCAVVDGTGHVHVANTAAKIKEAAGWTSTEIDETKALHGIACAATTSCVAIDETGDVIDLTFNESGVATATKDDIDGTNKLTAITCTASSTCVAVDSTGNVFTSVDSGETWQNELALGTDLTSVSCSAPILCVATDTKGEVTAFAAE
jgi:Zn-dependent metalloprotease